MNVFIFSDFDGTMTDFEGSKVVSTIFFQSLGKLAFETESEWITRIVQRFQSEFGKFDDEAYNKENSKLLINKAALQTFKSLVQKESVKIFIITRNNKNYVEALLRYQGFKEEELKKITLITTGNKYQTVTKELDKLTTKMGKSFIFEDNKNDAEGMKKAISEHKNGSDVEVYVKKPGQFNWAIYLETIEQCLKLPHHNIDSTLSMLEKMAIDSTEPAEQVEKNVTPIFSYPLATASKGDDITPLLNDCIKLN